MTTEHRAFVEHFKLIFFVNAYDAIVRVEITPKAMIQCFDAEMTPQSFLQIYRDRQAMLQGAALLKASPDDACILLDTDDIDTFNLQQQSTNTLNTPITLRPGMRATTPSRRDSSFAA